MSLVSHSRQPMKRLPTGRVATWAGWLLLVGSLLAVGCVDSLGRKPHEALIPLWRQYSALPAQRALALAGDPDRVWVAGAAGGQATEKEARAAALAECAQRRLARRMQAPCRIYAVGSRIVW